MRQSNKRRRSSERLQQQEFVEAVNNAATPREARMLRQRFNADSVSCAPDDDIPIHDPSDAKDMDPEVVANRIMQYITGSFLVNVEHPNRSACVVMQVFPGANQADGSSTLCTTNQVDIDKAIKLIMQTDTTVCVDGYFQKCVSFLLTICSNGKCETCNLHKFGNLMTIVAIWLETVRTEDDTAHMCVTVCKMAYNQNGDKIEARLHDLYCKYPASLVVPFTSRPPQGSSLLNFLVDPSLRDGIPPPDTLEVPDALRGACEFYKHFHQRIPVHLEISMSNRDGSGYFKYKVATAKKLHECACCDAVSASHKAELCAPPDVSDEHAPMSAKDFGMQIKAVYSASRLYEVHPRDDTKYPAYIVLHVVPNPSKLSGCRIPCSAIHDGLGPIVDSMMKDDLIPMNAQFCLFAPSVLHTCASPECPSNEDRCQIRGEECSLIGILISRMTRPDGKTTTCTSVCKLDYEVDEEGDDNACLNHLFVEYPSSDGEMPTLLLRFIVDLPSAELHRIGIPQMKNLRVEHATPKARKYYKTELPKDGPFRLRHCTLTHDPRRR